MIFILLCGVKLQFILDVYRVMKQLQVQNQMFNALRLRYLFVKSAVERLTSVRYDISRDYSSFITMVTSDYEAMCAYKCGEYERCLLLFERNVNSLSGAIGLVSSFTLPSTDLLLLMDDDCLSLVGHCVLGGVYDNADDDEYHPERVDQLSISPYLFVQCILKLKQSSESFIEACHIIR